MNLFSTRRLTPEEEKLQYKMRLAALTTIMGCSAYKFLDNDPDLFWSKTISYWIVTAVLLSINIWAQVLIVKNAGYSDPPKKDNTPTPEPPKDEKKPPTPSAAY